MAIEILDMAHLGICAIATVAIQSTFYVVATLFQTDKGTDFAGCGNFLVVAVLSYALTTIGSPVDTRQTILTAYACCWSIRLGGFLLYRVLALGRDKRFDEMRSKPLEFAIFWVFQASWVFIVSLPIMIVNSPENSVANGASEVFTGADIAGLVLLSLGLVIEGLADLQKYSFRSKAGNSGRWCDTGLWRYSRHPNYFGEMVFWWGAFTVSSSVARGWQWITVLSPLYTMSLLLFLSGLPILEKSADERYKEKPDYIRYKESTSPLILLPPTVYKALPDSIKFLFFEYPIYNHLHSATD